ncbi:MAG: NYN domain-containing protein [Pirellulales bacterium]
MSLLIDGYNLMHAAGIIGRGRGPGGFERSRLALLDFVAESIETDEVGKTTVVFDAAGAPRGLPSILTHRGLTVRFAVSYDDADELIEELIEADTAPRRLTVVSSDHRLQRAARRRKAQAIDSDRWYAEVVRRRVDRSHGPSAQQAAPSIKPGPPTAGEVEFWLERFSGVDLPTEQNDLPAKETDQPGPTDDSIFPPGYAEDEE